ncbi:phosphotransferase family protein [Aeromicrobium sp. UC242_57]|uniref:phosphotransferase family protein n=1 Tax=Aeromicrobium sp. UC242_57 TaxID=3374624 RepID=UPI0037AF6E2A
MSTDPQGFDSSAVTTWLRSVAPDAVASPLTATLITGGKSNLTYRVTDGVHDYVVRRPPLGHVLATAHDMAREHRVMSALASTAVPVPRMIALCDDPDVLGAPFYVMEHVDGTPYSRASQARSTRQRTHAGDHRTPGRHARRAARRRPPDHRAG